MLVNDSLSLILGSHLCLSLNIRFAPLELLMRPQRSPRLTPAEFAVEAPSSTPLQVDAQLSPICTSFSEAFSILAGPAKRLAVITALSTSFPNEICGDF